MSLFADRVIMDAAAVIRLKGATDEVAAEVAAEEAPLFVSRHLYQQRAEHLEKKKRFNMTIEDGGVLNEDYELSDEAKEKTSDFSVSTYHFDSKD
ncbi:hypothetical protein sscle_05g040480 [Sclerotinia sclerotiorum 1980 UF-70]|uniref:Uncharacterized protein n=1 Tax=Sclerotinia sclerotiorum (strain ATCC 18683 / 1980 / Ss-1) TaxID=665079 RepID=A0A1D9Q2V4_SCLS1|nr:hypothetical protein sscle_05g040480 [Sclerotinia sclerotiorum 1980 UF-70]